VIDTVKLRKQLDEGRIGGGDVAGVLHSAFDEIDRLRANNESLSLWIQDGAIIMRNISSVAALFHIGLWWANRPRGLKNQESQS
jgi:hypothetical protein